MVDLLTVSKERTASIERLAREFRAGRSVVLSTHINADGDGCGSEAALARILSALGMTVRFLHFSLFGGTLLSPYYYAVDTALCFLISLMGYAVTRTNQMVTQYNWITKRTGLISWRHR